MSTAMPDSVPDAPEAPPQMVIVANPATPEMTPEEVRLALHAMWRELQLQFLERRDVILALFLAIMCKQHGFVLGPPGTGKTALATAIFERFIGATHFETSLSKGRPAEAVLGPYDLPKLRDHGDMHRKYQGYLPDVDLATLDEVGKMSETLGHELLPVILERKLFQVNGGRSYIPVPLISFIGGSNELPTEESDNAAALWDRILVRLVVDQMQEPGNFVAMLEDKGVPANPTTVDIASLRAAIDDAARVTIPHDVHQTLNNLREAMRAEQLTASNRRWKQCLSLLKAAAWFEGRSEVDSDDVAILRHALWETPVQIDRIERLTLSVASPFASAALTLRERCGEIVSEANGAKDLSNAKKAEMGVALNGNIKTLQSDALKERQKALSQGASTARLDEVIELIKEARKTVYATCLNMIGDPA